MALDVVVLHVQLHVPHGLESQTALAAWEGKWLDRFASGTLLGGRRRNLIVWVGCEAAVRAGEAFAVNADAVPLAVGLDGELQRAPFARIGLLSSVSIPVKKMMKIVQREFADFFQT